MRTNQICVLVSGRGTGKSTFYVGDDAHRVKGVIPMYREKHPGMNIVIVDTLENPVYSGIPFIKSINDLATHQGVGRIVCSKPHLLWPIISRDVHNHLLIFEDAIRFVGAKLTKEQITILIDCKQKNNDIFFTYHALMQVAPDLIRLSDILILGKTVEVLTPTILNKFPVPDLEDKFNKVKNNKNRFHKEYIRIS